MSRARSNAFATGAPDEFLALVDAFLCDDCTDAEVAELNERLDHDPAARDWFVAYCTLCRIQHEAVRGVNEPVSAAPQARPRAAAQRAPQPIGLAPIVWSIAAALLLTAAVTAVYVLVVSPETTPPETPSQPVATLIDATGVVVIDNDVANPGDEFKPGSYANTSGNAQFLLTNHVGITMRGPTRLDVQSKMSASLAAGTAVFHCPDGAEGYTVHLPGNVRVVDLGTRFAIRVDEAGHATVQVLEGSVSLITPDTEQTMTAGAVSHVADGRVAPVTDIARFVIAPESPPIDAGAFAEAVTSLEPIAYWRFEDADGARFVDSIGQRVATGTGAVEVAGESSNRHVAFDGSGFLTVPGDSALNTPGNRLSISAWVNLEHREHQAIVHKWAGGSSFTLEIHDERPGFVVAFGPRQSNVIHLSADDPMPIGRWVLLTGVYDGTTVSLYIDGQIAAATVAPESDKPIFESNGPMTIGRRSERETGYVVGAIDEIAIFDRALSPQQIAQLHENSHHGPNQAVTNVPTDPASEAADR